MTNKPGYVEYEFRVENGRSIKRDVLQIECDPNSQNILVVDAGPGFMLFASRVECQFRFLTPEETDRYRQTE